MKKPITLFILLFILSIGQMWGETIPAGTIIYVDVTNFHSDKDGYATSGKYYMSVTASKNSDKQVNKSNTSGANWEQYDLNADTEWQELKLLSGNLYAGIVENESTVGSVSFWRRNKPDDGNNHLWCADACSPNAWDSSKRQFTIASGYTHNDDRHVACFSTTTSSIYLYPVGATLYLKVDSRWKSGNPRFAACFKGYDDDSWVDAVQVGESDYYSVTVPEGEWPYVIYCRMNPAESENGWDEVGHDRVWDQTSDIFAQHDRNLCVINTVDNETWSYHQYTWVYAPTPIIVGAMNDWTVMNGKPLNDGSASISLNADEAYPFKVVSVESWYGFGDTEHSLTFAGQTASQVLTAEKNDILLLTAGAGEYTFTWNEGTKTVSVSHPTTVTHPHPNYIYYKNTKGWTNVYAHIYGTQATVFPGPQLNSCTFNDVPYYYVALGNNANVEFNQGNSTNQDDLTNIASNKGKYYDPSTTSWKYFSATIELNNQSATSAGTENVAVEVFNTALTSKIICPSKTGYLFGGYWTEEDGNGVQLINYEGEWIASVDGYTDENKKWIHEGGTATLYAKWSSMLLLYQSEGFPLTSFTDPNEALFIDKSRFVDAHPGNRIKIDGPDASVAKDAKFFFGDYDVNHVPGSDFREVPTGSDVLPVYIYLTQEMIDYIQDHDLRIFGENMTINRVELEVGRADEYASQPQKVIWMGDFTARDLSTIDMCINQLDVDWTDYQNMIIYHNAGTKDYSFNVRTNWEESGIISFWNGNNHITQEKNFTVVDLVHSNASTVIGETPDRLFVQRDDHTAGVRTPFTITSIVLEKSDTATTGSTWSDATWSLGHAPTTDECAVITAPMTVDVDHAIAGRVVIDQYGHTGQLTIQPNKGLDVRLTVKKTTDGSTLETTSPADLVLESSSSGNASLIFENDDNAATVQMYSIGDIDGDTWNWQFMGTPFTSANALYSYYGSYLYEWQSRGDWDVVPNGGTMTPFTGYCITQDEPTTYVMDGTLNPNDDVEITIPASKEFVMANSWTAPISVCNFTATTLPLANKTIYLFNTGFAPKENGDAEQGTAAGTYVAMPINSAIYTGNYLIAPMEGFYVDNRSGSEATITLKYDELVRPSGSHTDIVAGPMHAPKRAVAAENEPAVMKIKATGSRYSERIVILEREDFSAGFDNGWDGKNLNEPGVAPILYALREDGTKDAVSAIPTYEGTVVGFRQGEDNAYTFSFDYDGEDVWYLNDLKEEKSTLIDAANTYSFVAEAGDAEARFIISATPIQKLPTDIGNDANDANDAMVKVRKLIINDQLFIIRAGRMYNAVGSIVK